MKEKSYTNLMKSGAMNREKEKEKFIQNLYIDMFLREIQLNSEKERLQKKIDKALDKRNKAEFIVLSKQLNHLSKRFGT